MQTTTQDALTKTFGFPIYVYSRADAIADGVLVDLMQQHGGTDFSEICRQFYKHPVACTEAVFNLVAKAVNNQSYANSFAGVMHDILHMSRAVGKPINESTVVFQVIIKGAGRKSIYDLKLSVGPGDDAEPVMTLMMKEED